MLNVCEMGNNLAELACASEKNRIYQYDILPLSIGDQIDWKNNRIDVPKMKKIIHQEW